jgi:hypothetical protein
MPARSAERIMMSIVTQEGQGAKMYRKFCANRERNWLLALSLNTFAKLATNAQLSDLEQSMVNAFRKNGFSDEELKLHGRVYGQIPGQIRTKMFPDRFAKMTPKSAYTMKNLQQDAPNIVSSVLAMRNVTNVDVQAIHAGTASRKDFPMVTRDVLKEHGSAMFVALAPDTTPETPPHTYTIKATSFRCNDETGADFLGSDEPYWIFGAVGGGIPITTRSQIFGDVDTGESRNFAADQGCIWGQDCSAQALPEGEIGVLVQLWEHDEGNPEKVRAAVAAAFAAAAGILTASGVAAWIGAVVAGVGAVVQFLLGFLDDDHIADQTFVFTRQVIEDQLHKVGQVFSVSRKFTDGDGDYSLKIDVTLVT